MTFSGCTEKVYIDVPKPYPVVVKCKIPAVHCNFKGEGSEPVVRLLECIVNQKRAMEVCAEGK